MNAGGLQWRKDESAERDFLRRLHLQSMLDHDDSRVSSDCPWNETTDTEMAYQPGAWSIKNRKT
jgi:hypothetical protein